jgi:osmoprotectant transport system permease protein
MGLSGRQVVLQAELPLAAPLLMTGVRTAAVQVVATATLAALVAGGGLGRIINLGFGQQDYGVVLAGALLVAVLAVLTELVLAAVSWTLTPGEKRLPFLRARAARPDSGAAVPL